MNITIQEFSRARDSAGRGVLDVSEKHECDQETPDQMDEHIIQVADPWEIARARSVKPSL